MRRRFILSVFSSMDLTKAEEGHARVGFFPEAIVINRSLFSIKHTEGKPKPHLSFKDSMKNNLNWISLS